VAGRAGRGVAGLLGRAGDMNGSTAAASGSARGAVVGAGVGTLAAAGGDVMAATVAVVALVSRPADLPSNRSVSPPASRCRR
jgi:hypothetical protein